MSKAINANRKGKECERAFANYLKRIGYKSARRGQQFKGGGDSPDVVCEELPNLHFEVKNSPRVRLGTKAMADALRQAEHDAGEDKWGIVVWRQTGSPTWLLTFSATGVTQRDALGLEPVTVVASRKVFDNMNQD